MNGERPGSELLRVISPDGQLCFVVRRLGAEVAMGFDGFAWHTHPEVTGQDNVDSHEEAVARYIEGLVAGRRVIAVERVAGEIRDIWITNDPVRDLKHRVAGEEVSFRHWDGSPAPVK